MIFGVTGHRPHLIPARLRGWRLRDFARTVLRAQQKRGGERVITGMALGWDTAVAEAAVNLRLPFVAAIPFVGQDDDWTQEQQLEYRRLLKLADGVVCTNETGRSRTGAYDRRNRWLVDQSELLVALYDGRSNGGTRNCIDYAQETDHPIINVWDEMLDWADTH